MLNDFVTIDLKYPSKSPPPSQKPQILSKVVNYFREYCDATSIHGFRYFGEKRTIYEKFWWLVVFLVCLILCVFSILSVYKKWDQSPVIVSFATKGKSICDIPFPAVTVCSESKVKFNVVDYRNTLLRKKQGEALTKKEEDFLGTLSFICKHQDGFNYSSLAFTGNFLETLAEVTPEFSIINCKYMSRSYPCKDLFTPIITDEGFCYTFNMLDRTELYNDNVIHYADFHNINKTSEMWSMENGYKETSGINTYPKRALLPGARYGLKFELKTENEKLDTLCRGSVQGYRLLFHAPMRLPRPSQEYMRVPFNRDFSATISPSQIMTSEAVKNYPSQKRQCFFPLEKKLKFFRAYSKSNCDTECLANFTLSVCQCVLFYMPRENGTRICTPADYECTQNAEYDLQSLRLFNKIVLKKKKTPLYIKAHICHCLPMCSDIEYKVSSSQSNWNWSEEIESGLNGTENVTNYHISKVRAYFSKGNFIGSERNVLYGPTDFLANFGGLLGLFTGFSILSLMEIIYFLSLRLICNVRMFGSWAGKEN